MITTSSDGQWAAVRKGRQVVLLAGGAGEPVGRLELESDDADLAIVGPPTVIAVVYRGHEHKVVLHQPPYLDAVARFDLDGPMKLAAITGPRMALVSADQKAVVIVRAAGRALSAQPLDPGSVVEFAVGLDRGQLLLGLLRKLEVWDAVSARPLLRLQLQLPPAPRTVGPAHGHVWATRPGSDEVFVYRLSDGRPFRHLVGAPVDEVVYHPVSPLIVLVTARGLVRLHCFAHSLHVIDDSPWVPGTALAQLVVGDDISLLGLVPGSAAIEPWRVAIGGAGAPVVAVEAVETPGEPPRQTAADKLRAMRDRSSDPAAVTADAPAVRPELAPRTAGERLGATGARTRGWRDPLATFGLELSRGVDGEVPVVPVDSELGELAHRLALPAPARRALTALYSLYLVGEPTLSIARLSTLLGDWTEALGQGELGALALLRRRHGKISLRRSVSELLDGGGPRAIRIVGGAATTPRPGAARLARDGKTDASIETELATRLGRIAVVERGAGCALLESRLHGATAVTLATPAQRPLPWPRDAGLIVVTDGVAPAWVSALPALA